MEKNIEIQSVIWKYSKRKGLTRAELSKLVNMKKGTLDHRCTNPETFRVGELRLIFDVLNVPQSERLGL